MTAAIFETYGPPDVIRVVEVAKPVPDQGEVLIRTQYAAVNPIDCMTRAGHGVSVERFPGVLGWDVAGTVVAVGRDVLELHEGDEVFGMPRFPQHVGCCADYVVSPAAALSRIPSGVSAREAAAVPMVALTAWQALHQWPDSFEGRRVLIHGAAGGVGHIAVQLAKQAGAHVIATASARNRAFLAGLGVDETHDYTQSPFEAAINGVDVALDTRGGEDIARLVQTLKPGGMVVSLKGSGDRAAQAAAAAKDVQLRAIMVQPDRDVLTEVGTRLQNGALSVEIASEFPLAEIARAHAAVEVGHGRGRVVLRTSAIESPGA
jgi:NADPH:quinone reductase-like Zn-dependent oxidoreductase